MKVLVTGGAGYIGSYVVKLLKKAGHTPIVFDNLSTGRRMAVPSDIVFIQGDIRDKAALRAAFSQNTPDAVMHFAGLTDAGESMRYPGVFFEVNVTGGLNLLQAMLEASVDKLIFSSSAAVYGNPVRTPIEEIDLTTPTNPYGETKLQFEKILQSFDHAYQLRSVSLRYFNVAGADPEGELGDALDKKHHLISMALRHADGQIPEMKIFGTDYETSDGTAIRDFIHVHDLAKAHLLALDYLANGGQTTRINLGSEQGYSVREVLDAVQEVTGKRLTIIETARRAGDPAISIASSAKARELLGWQRDYPDIADAIRHAWAWLRREKEEAAAKSADVLSPTLKKLALIIPAYNEEQTLAAVIRSIPKSIPGVEHRDIIIVNDGSRDQTYNEARRAGAEVIISHLINRGLGGALGTGLEYARLNDYDMAITLDADGQHDPQEIAKFVAPIAAGTADFVVGSRLIGRQEGMPLDRKIGNWGLNVLTYLFFRIWSTDSQSGYRGFSRRALSAIQTDFLGMEVSSGFFSMVRAGNLDYKEVPIRPIYTEYSRAKGQSNWNAFRILWKLFYHRFLR